MSKVTVIDRRGTCLADAKALVADFAKQPVSGRRVCIIGDMDALVLKNVPEYRGLGEFAATLGLDMLISCGPVAAEVFDATRTHREASSIYFNSVPLFLRSLNDYVREGDTVLLVCGSGYDDVFAALSAM